MTATIRILRDSRGVATLSLNRPDKHNAMSGQMIEELAKAATDLGQDDGVRVVVLTGAGDSFCAGADLGWMQEQIDADASGRAAAAQTLAGMLGALDTMPKPLIGRIQGQAFGGGLGLMSVCDIAIGVESARFAFTETRLGLIPATIGPYVVARMGAARARQVFMSARRFDAIEAVRLGLLARSVPPDGLDTAIEAEITPYLACAPGAVAEAKALARRLASSSGPDAITDSVEALVRRWNSAEAAEGVAAFLERRKPDWMA